MLSAAFFISVFSSVVWIFYAISNQADSAINEFALTTAVVILPIFVLWLIFGYIYQYNSTSVLNKNMYSLFKQMKKNQDYADLMAKILIEADDNIKDNIILSNFDMFITDMNELLSEIMKKGQLISAEQSDALWIKVKNGGKWAFGRTIIEISQTKPNFSNIILQKALMDNVLGGMILEFCSRYQSLVNALEKHDKERLLLNIVETGTMGKVFSLLAVVADSIRQNRDLTLTRRQMSEMSEIKMASQEETKQQSVKTYEEKAPKENRLTENARRLFVNTFTRKKELPQTTSEKDPLSVAFAKSFGKEEPEHADEPHFDISISDGEQNRRPPSFLTEPILEEETIPFTPEEDVITEQLEEPEVIEEKVITPLNDIEDVQAEELQKTTVVSSISADLETGFQKTQEKLADIKKEWEKAKQKDLNTTEEVEFPEEGMPEPKINTDDSYAYPFGGWMDAENYNK